MATAGGVDAVSIAVAAASAAAVAGAEAATNTSVGSTGSGGKASQLSLTPRFTQEEKEILYSLFHQHEEVIDIKYRKKQRSKYCVRDAWDQIVREFNTHPSVGAIRNIKQIQKFWLNARLRKQYPSRSSGGHQKRTNDESNADEAHEDAHEELVEPIKDEPEFQLNNQESSEHNDQSESYGEMELDGNEVSQMDDDVIEVQQQQQQHHHQTQQQQLQQHIQQHTQQAAAATLQAQQISVDQISAEKLTLNDLLQFKRPREEIILQIKHPDAPGAQITIPSPTRITIPTHHQPQQHTMATITASGYNQQIISEIKPQQITLAQYQAQQQQQQLQQQQLQQQQLAQQQLVAAQQQQQQQQQQHVKMQLQTPAATQFATSTPAFTCTTFNALPSVTATPTLTAAVPSTVMATHTNLAVPASVAMESFEDKINYFRLKEAELRFKEEQVALEHKKIELNRAQDELKHLREVHRLQVEELRMKIRILQEEEKQLRKNQQS